MMALFVEEVEFPVCQIVAYKFRAVHSEGLEAVSGSGWSYSEWKCDFCGIGHAASFVGCRNVEAVAAAYFLNPDFHAVADYIQAAFGYDDGAQCGLLFRFYYKMVAVDKQPVG